MEGKGVKNLLQESMECDIMETLYIKHDYTKRKRGKCELSPVWVRFGR